MTGPNSRGDGETAFHQALTLLDELTGFVGRRRHCSVEEAEEFASSARIHLMDNDYRVLRRYKGQSSLRTYLVVVLDRHLIDLRRSRWGVWRPSAEAKRTGAVAVRLDELLNRDGCGLDEAIETLRTNEDVRLTDTEICALAARLPVRVRRREEGEVGLARLIAPATTVEGAALASHRDRRRVDLRRCLRSALDALPDEDALILQLRFREGLKAGSIAGSLGLEVKPLYRRIDRLLLHLRGVLTNQGFDAAEVAELIEQSAEDQETECPW